MTYRTYISQWVDHSFGPTGVSVWRFTDGKRCQHKHLFSRVDPCDGLPTGDWTVKVYWSKLRLYWNTSSVMTIRVQTSNSMILYRFNLLNGFQCVSSNPGVDRLGSRARQLVTVRTVTWQGCHSIQLQWSLYYSRWRHVLKWF